MRTLAVMLLVTLSGCLVPNPGYEGDTGSTGGTGGTGGSTSTGATTTTTTSPPTTGESAGSESAGGSTGDEVTTEPAATSEPTTGGTTGSTGESTGEPPRPECARTTEIKLDVVPIDTGVVPPMTVPCPWGGGVGCEFLNFGVTEFYQLVNDGQFGRNVALIQFPLDLVVQDIFDWGYEPANVVAARLELVVWEQLAKPSALAELQIDLMSAADSDWIEGTKNAAPATGDEPSFQCVQGQGCQKWQSPDGPLGAVTPLGTLVVDPAQQMALDQDGNDNEYHMLIKSTPLPGEPLRERVLQGVTPSFAVSLKSPRDLGQQAIGIKLEEAPWPGPTLYLEMCEQWN